MKLYAILNVNAWSGFWAFGYIALFSANDLDGTQITIAVLLAAFGFALGMFSYLRISNWTKPRTHIEKEEG